MRPRNNSNRITALEVVVLIAFVIFLALPIFSTKPQSSALSAAAAAASSGTIEVQVLSYCAHWFARTGNACINDAGAGSQVAISWDDSGSMSTAISHCKSAGCKISFYCEGMHSPGQSQYCDIQKIIQNYSQLVNTYGASLFLPQLEIDAIREMNPSLRASVTQAMKPNGWSLVLKNWNNLNQSAPIARVVYEDLVNNQQYAQEFKNLAASNQKLLLTGIVHQGGYDGDAGASSQQAMQRFQEYSQFKNVELFYGTPTSYSKVKSYDGSLGAVTAGIGSLTQTNPASFLGGAPAAGIPLAQTLANMQQPQQQVPYLPSSAPVATTLYQSFTPTNPQVVSTVTTNGSSSISAIDALFSSGSTKAPASISIGIPSVQGTSSLTGNQTGADISATKVTGPVKTETTFENVSYSGTYAASSPRTFSSAVASILASVARLLASVTYLITGQH